MTGMMWRWTTASWRDAAVPSRAVLLVRLFIFQHDCARSFFASPGPTPCSDGLLSLATFTPYTFWRRDHAVHHAGTGTSIAGHRRRDVAHVAEYRALTPWRRIAYRLYVTRW